MNLAVQLLQLRDQGIVELERIPLAILPARFAGRVAVHSLHDIVQIALEFNGLRDRSYALSR